MFRKVLIFAMFATAAGYCFAANGLPQVVTSEVFYSEDKTVDEGRYEDVQQYGRWRAVMPMLRWRVNQVCAQRIKIPTISKLFPR